MQVPEERVVLGVQPVVLAAQVAQVLGHIKVAAVLGCLVKDPVVALQAVAAPGVQAELRLTGVFMVVLRGVTRVVELPVLAQSVLSGPEPPDHSHQQIQVISNA
jgi:hypothetical protein